MDKTTLAFKMLNKRLNRIHSTLVDIMAALMGNCAWDDPVQMIPALEELADQTYEMIEETDRLAGGGQKENRT